MGQMKKGKRTLRKEVSGKKSKWLGLTRVIHSKDGKMGSIYIYKYIYIYIISFVIGIPTLILK